MKTFVVADSLQMMDKFTTLRSWIIEEQEPRQEVKFRASLLFRLPSSILYMAYQGYAFTILSMSDCMLLQLPSQKGRRKDQIFVIHSDLSLTHHWIQKGALHAQSVLDKATKEVSVINLNESYHIFGVNGSDQLFHIHRYYLNYDNPWTNNLTIIQENIGGQMKIKVLEAQSSFYLYMIHQNGQIVLMVLSKESLKQEFRSVICQQTQYTKDVQIIRLNEKAHFISFLSNEQGGRIIFGLLDIQDPSKIEWITKNISLSTIFKALALQQSQIIMITQDQNRNFCKLQIELPTRKLKLTKIIEYGSNQIKNMQRMVLTVKQNHQYLYIVHKQDEIWEIQLQNGQQRLVYYAGQKIFGLSVFHHQHEDNLYYLNDKEILVQVQMQSGKWLKRQPKPILFWEQIQKGFEPIGDPGWHADAFYSKDLKIVAKKMRRQLSYQVNDQIRILDYLSHFTNVRCLHQIYFNKVQRGLTMNFIPGIKWDDILGQKDNLFARSPIARVHFACKLTKAMRKLQQNTFCHGDLHLSNILIDIKSADTINPQFQIQVIDYGNGFVFKQGELVSEGMTGLAIIVPFEAESIRKINFDPIGINAYQLGRNILQVLLVSRHSEVDKIEYYATKQLAQLQEKSQYPKQLHEFVSGLVHENPRQRNVWLFRDIDHLVKQTRSIFLKQKGTDQ